MFYLIRHGKPDYSERGTKIYRNFGAELAPLTAEGAAKIKENAKDTRLSGADLVLSSPYTRALQTAAIISRIVDADLTVETDLHEWLADKSYNRISEPEMLTNMSDYIRHNGIYPDGEECAWENADSMRKRLDGVLYRYRNYKKVIVVCHAFLISSISDKSILDTHPDYGGITEYSPEWK